MNLIPRFTRQIPLFVAALFMSVSACADWNLDSEQSQISFVSIKKNSVGEAHTFANVSGAISDEGQFSLDVDLKSVQTQIEIRDQRMQEHLFEVAKFPHSKITGQVDKKTLSKLKKGAVEQLEVAFEIDLHGKKVSKKSKLSVVKLSRKQIYVTSLTPVILDASDFGLETGIGKLAELAGLPSIDLAVPVNFNLVFTR